MNNKYHILISNQKIFYIVRKMVNINWLIWVYQKKYKNVKKM